MSAREEALHAAVCQAVAILNVSPDMARSRNGRDTHNILRQALIDYADAAIATVEAQAGRVLPELPEPYMPPPNMFCDGCGRPYKATTAVYPPLGCECGSNAFRGTIDYSAPVAQYTADQMRTYARAALGIGASEAQEGKNG